MEGKGIIANNGNSSSSKSTSTSNYNVIVIIIGTITIVLISIYNYKLELFYTTNYTVPVVIQPFKSRPAFLAPLWHLNLKNESLTETGNGNLSANKTIPINTSANNTEENKDENKNTDIDTLNDEKPKEKSKLVAIFTPWYGNPSWFFESQAIDKNKTFYTLDTDKFTCPKKCIFTHNLKYLESAELVVSSILDLPSAPKVPSNRSRSQIWAAFICESPLNQNLGARIGDSNGLFNWSTSYRLDSDVYWPSGHFYKYKAPLAPEEYVNLLPDSTDLRKKKLASWTVSNCITNGHREKIVLKLQTLMEIEVYGKCGKHKCPEVGDCRAYLSSRYKFYIAFENSLCLDYITEKFFDPFEHSMIPITYGLGHYSKVAPPHSYINILDYNSLEDLATYVLYLDKNDTAYMEYFQWKQNYTVLNDPTSAGLCNLCVHLWENDGVTKYYTDFRAWWENKPLGNKMTPIQEKYLKDSSDVCSPSFSRPSKGWETILLQSANVSG